MPTPIPQFDPGSLSLEFAYAGSLGGVPGGVPEQWHAPADLASWLAPRFAGFDGDVTERELVDAILLRDAIAALALDFASGRELSADDVDTVNLYAATPDIPPVLAGGRRQAGRTSVRAGQTLSAVAREAVRLLDEGNRGRVRVCAADDCGLLFFDESRSGNRRWCSMQRCGNVAKVRSFRDRASGVVR